MRKPKRNNRPNPHRIIKWAAITLVGIFLFLWGKSVAFQERGYNAVGGEYLLLLFPLFWKLMEDVAKDVRQTVAALIKPEGKED